MGSKHDCIGCEFRQNARAWQREYNALASWDCMLSERAAKLRALDRILGDAMKTIAGNKSEMFFESLLKAAQKLQILNRLDSARFIADYIVKRSPYEHSVKAARSIKRRPGVSVILPTFMGKCRILRSIDSLLSQTISADLFEVIVVLNGPDDGTEALLKNLIISKGIDNFQIIRSKKNGAGAARNTGFKAVRYDHITFLDDDDYFSPQFLEKMYNRCTGDNIVLSQIVDFNDSGLIESEVNKNLLIDFENKECINFASAKKSGTALTMTCIKMFPSYYVDSISFDEDLKNGEDVILWTDILTHFDPDVTMCHPADMAIYYREVREGSISRRKTSFEFNIEDRTKVILRLMPMLSRSHKDFVQGKILAAAGFMASYIHENPGELQAVRSYLEKAGINDESVMQYINKRVSKTLVVSYCFPPSVDTAGIVMAKRMLLLGKPFDVISNDMSEVREIDDDLNQIAGHLIGDHVVLKAPSNSIIAAKGIEVFTERTLAYVKNLHKNRAYKDMYSRVMWPASNFAAAAVKATYPEIRWIAEFSDPMVTDILSSERKGDIEDRWLQSIGLLDAIERSGAKKIATSSAMKWCEYLAYILADEIVFTNRNQMDYMLSQEWIKYLKKEIVSKSRVSPHPFLPKSFYFKEIDEWSNDASKINIAYFGSFYGTRGLDDVFDGLKAISEFSRLPVKLDVYCGKTDSSQVKINESGCGDFVELKEKLPYFKFLSRSRGYDYLLVNDAKTLGIKSINPYLPSKVSDYIGSGAKVWAICEPGSALSSIELPSGSIRSEVGNHDSIVNALKLMCRIHVDETPAAGVLVNDF